MKTIKVLVVMVMIMGLGNGMATTSAALPQTDNVISCVCTWKGYEKIDMKDVPERVMQAIEKEFPTCYFFRAYKGNEGGLMTYKIELINPTGASFYTIISHEGEILR